MKEIKRQIQLLFLTISLLFVSSCYQDDFLKDELLSNNSVDFLYSSSDGIANAVVGLYSLNREPYQRDWFNGAIPMILQAKSDISAGFDGEISLFSEDNKRTATVKALSKCHIGYLNKEDFFSICEQNKDIGFKTLNNLTKIMTQRLIDTNHQVLKLTTAFSLIIDN